MNTGSWDLMWSMIAIFLFIVKQMILGVGGVEAAYV